MAATWRQRHDRRAARVAISRRPRRRESAYWWFVGSVVLRRPRLLLFPLAPAPTWIFSCQFGASAAPPDPPPTPPTPQPRPTPRGPRKPRHPAACPIAAPSQMPMHSPTTAPTKLARPLLAATKPHQTPQQLLAARGHVLRAAGASAAAEGSQQQQHQHQQALTRAPPLATFWTHTRPQTRLQAPPEPPVHAGSGGSRGGRRRSRCCCVFAHVAAAASRARTHGSPGHNFSTAIAISEVLKPPRAPLARGFGAENMTPPPLPCWHCQ